MKIASKISPEELEIVVDYLNEKGHISNLLEIQNAGILRNCDELKLASLAMCKVIYIKNDEIHLTSIGERLANRTSEAEKQQLYCEILENVEPYKKVIDVVMEDEIANKTISLDDVAYIWNNSLDEDLTNENKQGLKEKAISFFRLCGVAGIGKLYLGRRGLQTRFIFDRGAVVNKMYNIQGDNLSDDHGEEIIENMNGSKCRAVKAEKQENYTTEEEAVKNTPENVITLTVPFVDGRKACVFVPKDANKDEVKYVSDMIDLFFTRQFGMEDN